MSTTEVDTGSGVIEVTSEAELRELVGEPKERSVTKERRSLHAHDRSWLATSPFCLIATAGADGTCDVSPKGDPPGFTLVLDDTTVAIPDRPGNRRSWMAASLTTAAASSTTADR